MHETDLRSEEQIFSMTASGGGKYTGVMEGKKSGPEAAVHRSDWHDD